MSPLPRRRFSLRAVLIAALVLVVVVSMGLTSLSTLRLMKESDEIVRAQGALKLVEALLLEHDGQAPRSAEALSLRAERWVEQGLVEGVVVGSTRVGVIAQEASSIIAQEGETRAASRVIETRQGLKAIVVMTGEGEGLRVVVQVPISGFEQHTRAARGLAVLYLFLVGLLVWVFAYLLLTRSIVRPVQRLTRATENVASGDLSARVALGGVGEVAELAERFNQMLDSLAQRHEEVQRGLSALQRVNDDLAQSNSALRSTRDHLVRSERLSSVGQLAAGIAHEIGNPLASMLAYLEMLSEPGNEPEEIAELLTRAERCTRRIQQTIRELLDYSRSHRSMSEAGHPFDLSVALEHALHLVTPQPKMRRARLDVRVSEGLPAVFGEEGKLTQLLVNLLLNAADALEGQDDAVITLEAQEGASGGAVIVVEDNGPGIPEDVLGDIFRPFFTTKPPGKGTGLGLAICEQLADQLGGSIDVETSEGEGTRFAVRLPRCPAETHA